MRLFIFFFVALKYHSETAPSEEWQRKNAIFLSEHYSETLNWVNGELERLNSEENLKVLQDRIMMLEQLNYYAIRWEGTHAGRWICFMFLKGFI